MSAFKSVDLAFESAGDGEPLTVILHGFLGSGRNWQTLAKKMAAGNRVIWADMRNHGASPWSDAMNYEAMAADVMRLLDRVGGQTCRLIGHSMGGKAAMATALHHTERIEKLVVVDIAPVDYDHNFDTIFAAMRSVPLADIERRGDADIALKAHLSDPSLRAFVLQNLDLQAAPKRWRCNIDVFERSMSTITGWPSMDNVERYAGPTLFLNGGRSDYVLASHRPSIDKLFAAAEFHCIDAAGHWLHAEAPQATLDAIQGFLSG